MKVKMLVDTHYGDQLKKGKVTDVPKDVAERWEKNGIAEPAETPKRNRRTTEPDDE